jgi:hypothetical protein
MKVLIIIIFILVVPKILTAQTITKEIKLPEPKGDFRCVYTPKYSKKQRDKFYPFNIADTIKLVSFRYHRHNYPIKSDIVLIDSLIENITLTKLQIHSLTDILYNNFYKKPPNYGVLTQCFFPRNAILFYDKNGNLKESILLCFQCDRHEKSSDKINFGSNCTQKMQKLSTFFISLGVKFGTNKNIKFYSGESSDD